MSASSGRISLELIQFTKMGRSARYAIRLACVRGHGMPDSCIKDKFSREVGMRGMYIKYGVFIFALLMKRKMARGVNVFNNELGDDSFESGVQTCILATARKYLANRPVCAVDRTSFLTHQGVVRVVEAFVAPGCGSSTRRANIIIGPPFVRGLGVSVVFAKRTRGADREAKPEEGCNTKIQINEVQARLKRGVLKASPVAFARG